MVLGFFLKGKIGLSLTQPVVIARASAKKKFKNPMRSDLVI
jgi:hypothetical protein